MTETYDPGEYTVDEVKEYVTDNPDQADEVLAAEQAGKNRSTLTDWLSSQEAAPQTEGGEGPELQEGERLQPTMIDPSQLDTGTPEGEEPTIKLPPTIAEAGGVGIVGTVSGMFTVSNGSYQLSPGQALVMSAEDAQTLVDQGVAVMLDTYKPPS